MNVYVLIYTQDKILCCGVKSRRWLYNISNVVVIGILQFMITVLENNIMRSRHWFIYDNISNVAVIGILHVHRTGF